MADDLQQNTAGTDLPVNPQLPQGAFEAVLAALAGGSDAEEALSNLQDTVRQSVLDAGGSAGAADHAANVFINTFRDELFDGSRPLTDAADYAGQAMQTAIDTYDPSAQNVSPSDALLAAIASGNGVEEAVSRVVAEMGGDMDDAQSGQVENVFLDELQSSLARGDSPDAAVNSATQAAQTGLQSLQQAEVPVDNPVLSALAGGENVDEVLQDAAQRSGGDADAFINGLEDSLANGTNANQAMNDAQQAAVDSAQARQDAEVELNAADQLAAALASGDSVDQALGQTGGGDAFAAALEDALANGAGAGEAMNQADQAQQQQNTVAQQQSVPLSPADQMAASLASGENVDQVMQAAGGNENFAAALEQSLADGAAPSDAMQSGQQAANAAQQTAQQQSVPLSPADQMAASLASGNNVDQTLSQAGGGDAFGAELEAALANGQSPDQSMAQAGAAQQAANTAASQQNVPADPAMQALAQGGGSASGQEMANAISEVTGTTGEPGPQPGGNPPPQQSQTAEQGQPQSGQPAGGEAGGPPQGGPGNGGGAPQTQTADQGGPQSGPPSDGGAGGQQPPQQTAAADTQGQSQPGPQGGQPAGGDQPQGQPQGQQQAAGDQPQEQPQGGQQPAQGGEPQQQAQDSSGTGTEGTEPGNDQTQTAQTGGPATEEVVETVEEVVETTSGSPPGQTKEATEAEVTETIQTASGNAASEDETEVVPEPDENNGGTPVTPTAQQGGGGDLPTEEEIEALQNIATAAGGNQSGGPSSNLGFNQLLNPTIGNSGLGGTSTQSTTRTTTTTTTTRQSRDEDDSNGGTTVVDTNDVTPNSAPVADDDFETSAENAILTVNVAGNDSDPDSDALSVTAATVGANSGTVTFSGGSITFDPGADFDDLAVGEDRDVQISYTVSDPSGATDTAILTVTVTGTNDVPTVSQAIDAGVTNEDDPDPIRIELLSVASDLDMSDDLDTDSVVITSSDNRPITSPPHFVVDDDTGILEIAPFLFQDLPNGQQVTLSVSYNVVDGNGGIVANTAQVVIEGRNDAPDVVQIIRVLGEDNPVFAIDLLIDQSDVDASDTLSAVNLQQVANGSRIVGASIDANGNLIFAAGQFEDLDDGETEVLSFTYDVSDGTTTTQNTVQVTINGSNDAPVVSAVTRTFGEDSATFTVDLLAGQSDVDGEPLSAVNLQQVANGSRIVNASIDADGNLIITAGQFENLDDGESEVLSFTYDVSDGTTTTQNTVQVTITGSNDAPSVAAIATTRGEDSGAVSVNLLTGQTDVDVEALSAASLAQTGGRNVGATIDANGNLVFAAGQFEDLDDGESEVLSFTYDVSDGTTTTQNTVQVTINGSNDAPVVSAVTRTFGEDSATFTVDLLAGQSDVDGEPLSAVNLQQVANGSRDVGATIDADGNLVFAAGQFEDLAAGQSEVLSFTYGVSDGTTTTQNTVSVTITGTNDAPTLFVPGALSTTGTGTNGNDSSFSYAAVADFDTFPTEAGTIETWVKTTDSNGALLSYAVPGSPNELWVTLSGGNLQVWLNNSNLGSVGAGSLTDGNWHHVALSFGPGVDDTVLHVDGQPVLSLGATGALTTGGTLVLGSDQDAVGGSFESSQALDAEFDGLRVWNSVRSEANIQATMSVPLDPLDHPDLIAEYGFDGSLESSVPGAPPITLNNAEISSGDALQSGVEDTAIPLTGIVVADADGDVLTVTLTSAQGSLAANPGFGGATVQAVANGISITGTPADVQAAMGTATFTGAPDFFGTANVTVSVDDGTAPTETRTVEVTVTPDNDAPDILGVTGHSALALDGNDGRVEIADVPDFTVGGNSPITVEMWLNPDSVSGLTTIFDKSDRSQADYSTYRMHIIDGTIGLWNGATSIPYSGPIVAGQWQHVAFTFDGTTMNAYIDGQLKASAPFTLGAANSDPWTIGDDVIAGRNFDGLIDDVRVWNTARSQAEIQASMNGELAEPWSEPGLVMNLSFDGADGATVTDATGHGNDGTMSGGASIVPGVGVYATVSNSVSLEADSVLQGTIVAGDADGDALSYSLSADGAHGTAVVNADGTYSYTPDPGFSGVDAFAVRVADGNGGETVQQISVTVNLINNAPLIAGEATNVSAVAEFNGANAHIDVPDATVNGLTAGTIETWVYLDTNNQEAIFTQQANGVNSLAIFRIGDGTPGQVLFQGSNQSGTISSNTTIPTGEWHHVAITFDNTQANLYIDGQLDATVAGNFSIVGASGGQITGTAIGAWLGDGSGRYFDGQMSEFRIWDHARTDTEIADNYQASLVGDEAGLRALYNFTDGFGPGETVADATGNFDGVSANVSATFSETMTFNIASEDFENGASGWSNSTTTDTATVQTEFMGAFGNGASTSKTFTLPAGASETTISFDFYKMDTWDGENFQIQIGGQTVAARSFVYNSTTAGSVPGIDDTVAVTFAQGVNQGPGFNGGWDDHSFRVEMTLTQQQIAALPVDANGNPMLQLGFTSTLDQGISDESWGIDNLAISAEIPVGGIESGSGTLSSNLLSDASDPDGDVLTVSNASVVSSNGARTVSYTLDGASGALSIDTAQFANLGAGQSEVVTVTYDVIDEHGAATAGSRSFTIHGTQNAVSLGTADYVEIGHHADLEPGTGDMTAEMWFYWPGAGGVAGLQFLMSKGNTDGSTDPGYSLFMNGNTLIARTSTGTGQGELELDMSGVDSGWHHVAMVIDQGSHPTDGQLSAYLDGSENGWTIAGGGYDDVWTKGNIASTSDSLMIGDPAHSPSAQGTGYTYPMDEVRIWDTARTELEINQTMHQQLSGNETGLSGYWTFNESVGTAVTDLTGNGHDGTMSANAARENLIELSISNNEVYKGLLMGSDPDGDQLSYSLAQGPQHGSVSFNGNTFVYDHDGSGSDDSFIVEISDGTDTVTEQIDVTVV